MTDTYLQFGLEVASIQAPGTQALMSETRASPGAIRIADIKYYDGIYFKRVIIVFQP